MVVFRPAPLRLVRPEWTDRVPAPASDTLSAAERRQFRLGNNYSYLNVTLSPDDEPARSDAELLVAARGALDRLLDEDVFSPESQPQLCLYRLADEHHVQIGIVGEVPISEYDAGVVRIHEEVRPQRVALLAEHMEAVGAVSSPVALAIRHSDELAAWIVDILATPPDLDFGKPVGDEVRQTIWRVSDPARIATMLSMVGDQTTYIIDGHHRAAAASAASKREPRIDAMLVALFPEATLTLLGFNRWVREVPADLLDQLNERFGPLEAQREMPDVRFGTVAIYFDTSWYSIDLHTKPQEFDVVNLRRDILAPICGIESASDERLVNIAGDQPLSELVDSVDRHGGMAIVLAPIKMDAFLAAADAGVILPPKSTYFTPKVRSGVFLRTLI